MVLEEDLASSPRDGVSVAVEVALRGAGSDLKMGSRDFEA